MQNLKQALPIMVNNYAKAFGVKVRMQGTNAYTDGQVITIPRLDLTQELTARYAYGYLAHEAAHIRYSDFTLLEQLKDPPLLLTIFNILEDARVERLIGKEFIGVWENLLLLRLYEQGYASFEASNPDPLQRLLTLLINYAALVNQRFDKLRPRCAKILKRLRQDFKTPLLIKVLQLLKTSSQLQSCEQIAQLARQFFELLEIEFNANLKSAKESVEQTAAKSTVSAVNGRSSHEQICELGSFDLRVLQPTTIIEGMCNTNSSSREDLGSLLEGQCLPGDENFITKVQGTYELRRSLSLLTKAYCERFAAASAKGRRLNLRKLITVPLGHRDIFFKRTQYCDYQTSIHLLVDVSGSMMSCDNQEHTRAHDACLCALSLALALEGISGIQNMVSFFPGLNSEIENCLNVNQKASQRAAFFDQNPRGSTPLAQAIWYALSQVATLDCARNIILVLTDGIPDSIEQTKLALKACDRMGIEVYAIGIKLDFITTIIPNSSTIQSASQLNEVVFKLFPKILG